MTDGHTRAFSALKAGMEKIPVVWDTDDTDLDGYKVSVKWWQGKRDLHHTRDNGSISRSKQKTLVPEMPADKKRD